MKPVQPVVTRSQRVEECRDEGQLLTWLPQAAEATTAEQLFAKG